jgi:hypothetical protein
VNLDPVDLAHVAPCNSRGGIEQQRSSAWQPERPFQDAENLAQAAEGY